MAKNNLVCMIASDEEDEDGNLSENEVSMDEGDEEYEEENLSEDSSASESDEDEYLSRRAKQSKSSVAKSKSSMNGEVESEDSSSNQPEDEDETGNLNVNDRNTKHKKPIRVANQNEIKKNKSNLKTKQKSTKRKRKVSDDEDSDFSSSDSDSGTSKFKKDYKYARQPTPKCDAIMKEFAATQNCKPTKEKSPDPVELNEQSNDLKTDPKIDPTDESKTNLKISDPLLVKIVKKEEDDIKLETKEEIDDESNEGIKTEDESMELVDEFQEILKEDQNVMEDNKSKQSKQNKRKTLKRKNEDPDDPPVSQKTKKSTTNSTSNQQGKIPSPVNPIKRRGRPPKHKVLPLAERNKESENNLLPDVHETNKQGVSLSNPMVLSGRGRTQSKGVNHTSADLHPTESVMAVDSDNAEPTPSKKRGKQAKNKGIESALTPHINRSAINQGSDFLTGKSQNLLQLQQNVTVRLEYIPESLLNNLLKTYVRATPTVNEESVFDNTDLSFLQQLDTHVNSTSQTVKTTASMSAKETNCFVADYLISHQSVFDKSFFHTILPVLSEILMLCMDEFTALLIRNKKAENVTSQELRRLEVKLAMQSFCTMVSTYSEKFFPNFNSVMYKIDQNNTKKGLIIVFLFFIANSVWIKAPKFKGQIHTMRKMLMCMCQIRKINSPLFLVVLTTPEKIFNDELRLLVKILLVLKDKNVLAIPTTALPETSSDDSIEEMCESIMSSSTDSSCVSDSTSNQQDAQKLDETLDGILCMLKHNNPEKNSELSETSIFASGISHSLTQQDMGQVLAESLEQDPASNLESLIESYLKTTCDNNDGVKTELDGDEQAVMTGSLAVTVPMSADDVDKMIKEEEIDCASLLEAAHQQDPFA